MYVEHRQFLSEPAFEQLKLTSETGEFTDVRSDIDGVVYPHICTDIPKIVVQEVEQHLHAKCKTIFMRKSPRGVECPNVHHTDNSMGRLSFMLYLQDAGNGTAGTSFVRHDALGVAYIPQLEALVEMLRSDSNNMRAWTVHSHCRMEENKACIFDAGWFHRADPVGGFGKNGDARCVLTAFVD